jgi:hypothetical protein
MLGGRAEAKRMQNAERARHWSAAGTTPEAGRDGTRRACVSAAKTAYLSERVAIAAS